MNNDLLKLFELVKGGKLSAEDAVQQAGGTHDMDFASVDTSRAHRCGFPEVILAQGKTSEQVCEIARVIYERHGFVLITRVGEETGDALVGIWPDADYNKLARTVIIGKTPEPKTDCGTVLVVCAGTSDLPVAEEALVTSRARGADTELIADVGVAGIHRLLKHESKLHTASAIVVVAGMEGALPSVVGGLVAAPVIAVPTSTGYGAAFGGVAALLGMLNTCASGVSVVNIDNGFGAGYTAAQIALGSKAK